MTPESTETFPFFCLFESSPILTINEFPSQQNLNLYFKCYFKEIEALFVHEPEPAALPAFFVPRCLPPEHTALNTAKPADRRGPFSAPLLCRLRALPEKGILLPGLFFNLE